MPANLKSLCRDRCQVPIAVCSVELPVQKKYLSLKRVVHTIAVCHFEELQGPEVGNPAGGALPPDGRWITPKTSCQEEPDMVVSRCSSSACRAKPCWIR